MSTPIDLANGVRLYVCKLANCDCVMLWVRHHPLDATFHATPAEAIKLANDSEAKLMDGGTLRLGVLEGFADRWVLWAHSRPMQLSLVLDTETQAAFRAALKAEAAAEEVAA